MASVQLQAGDAGVHGFIVAAGRHQPDTVQHLPYRQAFGHGLAKLVVGAMAFAEVGHAGKKRKNLPVGAGFLLGAGDEVRTRDLDLGKVALYQLSYSRLSF